MNGPAYGALDLRAADCGATIAHGMPVAGSGRDRPGNDPAGCRTCMRIGRGAAGQIQAHRSAVKRVDPGVEVALEGIGGVGAHPIVWLLAIAAALFGVLGCVFGATSRWRYRGLQQRVLAIEEARKAERARRAKQARLHAFVEQQVEVTWYLTIQNRGPAEAKNLTGSINGAPLDNSPLIDPKECDLAGLGAVGPHQGLRIPLHTADRPPELELELTWSDDSGQLGFYQVSLPDDRSLGLERQPGSAEGPGLQKE